MAPSTSRARHARAAHEPSTRDGSWHRPALRAIGVLGSYLVLSVVLLWPLLTKGFTTNLPVGADAVLDSWGFSWLPFAIVHGQNPFFTTFVGYPGGVNLLANTTQLGLAFVEWPVTAAFGPIASFNLACLLAPVLTGGSTYLLARRFSERWLVAWVAGLFFGFSSYELVALSSFHFQLVFVPLVPLFFLALHELLVRRRCSPLRLGLGIAALVIGQFFISTEVLVMTTIFLGVATVVSLPFAWRALLDASRYVIVTLVTAAVTSIVVLAYPLAMTLRGQGRVSGLEILTPQAYRADLLGPLFPTVGQWIAPAHAASIAAHFASASSENYSYLGIPLALVLVVGTVALFRRRLVLVTGISAAVAFILSLGGALAVAGLPASTQGTVAIGTWLPGRLIESLPLLENVIPSRFAIFTALGSALVLAAVLEALAGTQPPTSWPRRVGCVAIVVACALPLIPALPLSEAEHSVRYHTPPGFSSIIEHHVQNESPIITYPYPTGADMSAVRNQQALGFPYKMPAGYFRVPQGPAHAVAFDSTYGYGFANLPGEVLFDLQTGHAQPITIDLQLAFIKQLHEWGITRLVATLQGPSASEQGRYLSTLLGPPVAHKGVTYLFAVAG